MKVFRVFISSTFSDMEAEREALHHRVFPALEELCRQHGAQFQPIDLRWGISEAAGCDHRTMSVCLEEIRRCQEITPRPNFLLLQGDRSGWHPLPSAIPSALFSRIERELEPSPDGPAQLATLHRLYQRDDNAVPSEYRLQPRREDFLDGRVWGEIETLVAKILRGAVAGLGLSEAERLVFEASATEQEIHLGVFGAGAQDRALAFIRTIEGVPTPEQAGRFFDSDGLTDQGKRRRQQAKERLSSQLKERAVKLCAALTPDGLTLNHLDLLCKKAYAFLSAVIEDEIARAPHPDALQQEREGHEAFAKERRRGFLGRDDMLQLIESYIMSDSTAPLAIIGEAGCGKSSLMARAAADAAGNHQDTVVLQRFVGATPGSAQLRGLLAGVCRQLAREYGKNEEATPTSDWLLYKLLGESLHQASAAKPLIVFLDGLEQLFDDPAAANFPWISPVLPPFVRLIVSALPDVSPALTPLMPPDHILAMPPLSSSDAATLLDNWLAEAQRSLTSPQRDYLLDRFAHCPLPLYLKLAFEEARHWRSYSSEAAIGADIRAVITERTARLSSEVEHGKLLVARSLGSIAAARNGLSEEEILQLLSADRQVMKEYRERSPHSPATETLPPIIWARLRYDLAPYLSSRLTDGALLLTFFHRVFRETVSEVLLPGASKAERHQALAGYFGAQPMRFGTPQRGFTLNRRKISEWPCHLAYGQQWAELERVLLSLEFLQAKIDASDSHSLVEDLDLALHSTLTSALEAELGGLDHLRTVRDTIQLCAQRLDDDREQLAGQLLGRLVQPSDKLAPLLAQSRQWHWAAWLNPVRVALRSPGGKLVGTLAGHTGYVNALAILPDGKTAVSASHDSTLRLWDLSAQRLSRIRWDAHGAAIRAIAIHPARQLLVSAGEDRLVKVWDLRTLTPLGTPLSGHQDAVVAVAVTPDGRYAVSASEDRLLMVWELATGRYIRELRGHEGGVRAVALTPDGTRVLSGAADGTVRLWDMKTGQQLALTPGREPAVTCIAITADGMRAVSGSQDSTLTIWELGELRPLKHLRGHADQVLAVATTPDGMRAVSGSADLTVRVWELDSGRQQMVLSSHSQWPTALAVTPDNLHAISGSDDTRIHIWDIQNAERCVIILATSSDGSRAVSCCDGRRLTLWDTQQGAEVAETTAPAQIGAAFLEPNGDSVVLACSDGRIRRWRLDGALEEIGAHDVPMSAMVPAASPGSQGVSLLSLSEDGVLWAWDSDGKSGLQARATGTEGVSALAPADTRILLGSVDGSVRVARSPEPGTAELLGNHDAGITALGATVEGSLAVSGSADGCLKLWELSTGADLASFSREEVPLTTTWGTPGRQLRTYEISYPMASSATVPLSTGHTGSILAVAVAPDASRLASCGEDDTLRLWDVSKRREQAQIHASVLGRRALLRSGASGVNYRFTSNDPPVRVAFLEGGARLLTASRSGLQAWDAATAELLFSLPHATKSVQALQLRGGHGQVVAAYEDGSLRLWNLETGRLDFTAQVDSSIFALAVSPEGRKVLYSKAGGRVYVWDLAGKQGSMVLDAGHIENVGPIAFVSQVALVSGADTGFLRVWSLESQTETHREHVDGRIVAVAADRKRRLVVSAAEAGVQVWDLVNNRELRQRDQLNMALSALALAEDAGMIFAISQDGRYLTKWRLEGDTHVTVAGLDGEQCFHLAVNPGGTRVVLATLNGTIAIWDVATNTIIATFGLDERPTACAIADSGDIIAIGDFTGKVHLLKLQDGERQKERGEP